MAIVRNLQRRRQRRVWRTRNQVRRNTARPRMSVFRSNKHIYVQVIDDCSGRTIVSASSAETSMRGQFTNCGNADAARGVGKILGQRCLIKGVSGVVFDRGGYKYHGRVAALADGAREAGLQF